MKKFLGLFIAVLVFGLTAFGQATDVVADSTFFKELFDLVMNYKNLSSAAGVIAVVQLLVMFLKTPAFSKVFKNVSGALKMLIVSGLTLVLGVLTLKETGLSTAQALADSSTLVLIQVFVHQVYLQFFVKKD